MANTKCLSKYTRNGVCKIKAENDDLMFSAYLTLSACSDAKILKEHDRIVVKNDISTVNEIYKNFNKETKTAVIIIETATKKYSFVLNIPSLYHEKVAKFLLTWCKEINPEKAFLISDDMGYSYGYITNEHGTFVYKHGLRDDDIISLYNSNEISIKCLNTLKSIKWVMCVIDDNTITTETAETAEISHYTLKDFNENKVIISDDNIIKAYDNQGHRIAYCNCNALRYAIEYPNKNNIKPVETASEQPEVSSPEQSNNTPETEPEDHYYFTNFNDKIFEGFFTSDGAYNKAIELANKYNCVISVYDFFFNTFCYAVAPDGEPETEETVLEFTAPAELPEKFDDVPETASAEMSSYPLDVPFDMRIKHLCRICKHLESFFDKDRSKVLEYYVYNHEYCGDVCGECTLCCPEFENVFGRWEVIPNTEEIVSDGDLPF